MKGVVIMTEMYKEFIRYGVIVKDDNYEIAPDYFRFLVIELNDVKRLFFLKNGEVKHTEIVK